MKLYLANGCGGLSMRGDALWRRVFDIKYDISWGGWCVYVVRWSLWSMFMEAQGCWRNFFKYVRLEAGNCTRICFWHDCWNGNSSFKERYPELSMIARDRDARGKLHV